MFSCLGHKLLNLVTDIEGKELGEEHIKLDVEVPVGGRPVRLVGVVCVPCYWHALPLYNTHRGWLYRAPTRILYLGR